MARGSVKFGRNKVTWTVDTKKIREDVREAMDLSMNDCVDDLVQVSSQAAPHDKGILEKMWDRDVQWVGKNQIKGTVSYSVTEESSGKKFDYALWTHEEEYNLGEGSKKKPAGVGMSGKSYPVGRKYLTRPLYGEAEAYKEHMQNMVDEALK